MSPAPETYTVVEHLHTGAVFELVRARDDRDGTPVVLKRLEADRRSEAEDDRLRREYELLRGLDVPGVVRARGLHEAGGALSLVLEDAGGATLASFLQRLRPDLRTFLDIAIQLAEVLGQVHSRQVIHKDIKPRNIVLDGELRVQLIDFGIAVRLPREIPAVKNPNVLQGTLAYMSPEQTGRMNRAVDHRSDLYSLGVTLFEMLIGQTPFMMRDPVELIHAHVAKRPLPPHELDPAVPPVLSDIILKLLAKTAEGRYRSAFGLRADLERCRERLQGGAIDPFPLGERDVASSFRIPEAIYGRDVEIAALEAVLARVREGASELAIVRGPAGAGKSTVIHELQRSLGGSRGFFIAGKFDPLRRDVPYSAVRDALGGIVRHLLAESEQNVARWRWTIDKALGPVSNALVHLLPDLQLVLGPQPPLAELPPAAARARFHRAITSFCRLFARPRSPLVLFLDDLQWADGASLDLLVALLGEPEAGGLMCVGSFREAEVERGHPLRAALAEIAAAGCTVSHIDLGPLDRASLTRLVADTLDLDAAEVAPLAALVDRKTGGNAFFAAEFLRDLHKRGLLEFDPRRLRWTWDLARITDAPATDNVIDLMIDRARALAPRTREVLQLAACVGGGFEPERLAALSGRPRAAVEAALAEAVAAGMIVAHADAFRFAHDRVQEAVDRTQTPEARAAAHLALARLLRAGRAPGDLGDDVFLVADHARLAGELLRDPAERRDLAEVHLFAARRARAAAAFAPAARYCAAGIEFLSEETWSKDHELAFNLHQGSAECEFLIGNLDFAEQRFRALQGRARGALEQAEVLRLELNLRLQRGEFPEAVELAGRALKLLGEPLPARPGTATILAEYLRTRRALSGRTPEALLRLPPLRDVRVEKALLILSATASAGFQSDVRLLAVIAMRTTRLALQHGLSSGTAANFVTYGMIAGSFTQDDRLMDAYGQLGLAVLQRFPDPGSEAIVRFLYSGIAQPLCHPLRACIASLRLGLQAGLDGGYPSPAAYCAYTLANMLFASGASLDQTRAEAEHAVDLLRRAQVKDMRVSAELTRHACLALMGQTSGPGSFTSAGFDEQAARQPWTDATAAALWYWHLKIVVLTVLGMYDEALVYVQLAAPTVAAAYRFGFTLPEHMFYRSVVLAAVLDKQGAIEQTRSLRSIRRAEDRLAGLAAITPDNFQSMFLLVRAERIRLGDVEGDAIAAYEQAVAAAREHGLIHHEALARERAGEYYLGRGLGELGRMQLARARQAYLRWGARAKLERMERRHPGVERWGSVAVTNLDTSLGGPATTLDAVVHSVGDSLPSTARTSQVLDVASILKATQAFAAEIDLERLEAKVMRIVVENAGAERGVLLLEQPLGLVAVAEYSARSDSLTMLGAQPVETCGVVPVAAIMLARRTGKPVAVDDAAKDPTFEADPYVRRRRLRSLLAAPLLHQGKRLGLLYLDNNLATGVFTPQRLETLKILAVQAAISIEHAMFYADLDHARQAAEAANLAKSRFLANMSHELRTPLNAILGYSELLAEEADARGLDEMTGDLVKIRRAGSHLLALISDILDLTKIEAGKLELRDEVVVLSALLADVVSVIGPEVARQHNNLELETDDDLGTVRGDPLKIRQVLLNILNNAAKFTEHGRITLRARRRGPVLRFEIADTGIGMTHAQMASIFEAFTQVDASPSRRFGGAGLGLTISRRLCELMGGRIAVDSQPGAGTTFVVELPVRDAEA